ncbi:MAG TPA: FAD-dependent oxidoreductase [Acetobacteraceae bacterium]|nr:FAD-dependent oxidoreductase [Acetobacteraceae bacterium]
MSAFDLIVIGGGLVGGAIAWGAAARGAAVVVLDEGDVAFRAARGNFGLVWVQSKGAGMPPYAHWSRRSAELWPALAARMREASGADVALEQPGGLHFCFSEAELEARADLIRRMHNESGDIGTRIVDRAELRAMVPGIGDRVAGASFCPIDGHANPLFLLRALHSALLRAGGAYRPGHGVDLITPDGGAFIVRSGAESFTAPKLVIAAGLGSRRLAPMVGLEMPVSPLRGQILVTERVKPLLHYATHILRQTAEGSVMAGDSQEDVGFDAATTVPVTRAIAARAVMTFPALAEARIVRMWGALRVMTPDGFPIYEQSARYPGAFAATCHSGVTLAAAHALDLAPSILDGALPAKFDAFKSSRFDVPARG